MQMKVVLGGKLLWAPNMAAIGAGGAHGSPRVVWGGALEVHQKGWRIFSSYIRFDLCDGMRIRFWDDVWCGEVASK
jgi:hypothetical protein